MPELPEVETMVRGLRPALGGGGCVASRSSTRRSFTVVPRTTRAIRPGRDGERGGSTGQVGRRDPGRIIGELSSSSRG